MRAITFQGVREVKTESIADPELVQDTDVLVRVELTAVCGSDLHVYHGRESGLDAGTVMGHEFVGRVVARGRGVQGLDEGTRVLSPFTTNCGRCFFCRKGLTARCTSGQLFGWVQDGTGLEGAQAEMVRVPLADSTLLPVPDDVLAEEALLLGDVLSTGYYCASRGDISPGGTCVVLGCGPVGLMAIVGALEHGAERVFAVDRIAERLELARSFGAEPLSIDTDDIPTAVADATDGRGADTVLEGVGNESAHRLAMELVRPGGTISVVGVHNEETFAFRPVEAYDKNLTYRVGRCPARHFAERLIPLVQQKKYDLARVISHRMNLDDGAAAYDRFDRKLDGCTKVVLEI